MSDVYQQLGIIRWVARQPTAAVQVNLMIIVEPSISDNAQADQLLTAMLKAINLTRDEVCVADMAEMVNQPRFLLVMGESASQSILESKSPLDDLRGKLHFYGEHKIPLVVTYHPLDLMRNPADKKKAYSDLLFLRENLK